MQASLFGNAVMAVRGHADSTKLIAEFLQMAENRRVIRKNGNSYTLANGTPLDLNNVKGIAMDARIPTCMLVGYFGRDVTRTARQNAARAIHLIEPTLDTWGIPYFPIEGPDDLPAIASAYRHSLEHLGPSVILVGAPTS